ncbi:hypothetical protein ABS767_11760 [Sphingomonas sp. ST-64]|uniref:RiboL-PSP-HEPN domain-containing protein n=1 Tax=Sphingomonas plantiphila TaxID=3163295 RepID=A0ABW8YMY0_9SPHN
MSYYDAKSPRILVHDIHDPVKPRNRYIAGKFPEVISGRALDENLMSFWDATRQPNAILRFIFYYRIIEYAASHYVDSSVRAKLAKVLANPAVSMDIQKSVDLVLSAYDGARGDDVPRFNALLQHAVAPEIVWKEIENNKAAFAEDVIFDGGFKLNAILDKNESLSTFSRGGMVKFANAIRGLRNVLAHGRDQNTSTAITPTPRNLKYLSVWVNAIAAAAGEVVLYGANP